ncbi:MAG: zinc ribbon domain-containing protein, partial [Terriglobia bacterium]
MPDLCSCGAELPPDARFCHKCGKPQRDEPDPGPAEPPLLEIAQRLEEPPKPFPPSFHNPVAVRIGLFAASVATMGTLLLAYGFVIWLVAAGFFSVYLFSRRTGQFLTVRSGARMGWITGILSFVILMVIFTTNILIIAGSSGGLAGFLRDNLGRDPGIERALPLLESPGGQATL